MIYFQFQKLLSDSSAIVRYKISQIYLTKLPMKVLSAKSPPSSIPHNDNATDKTLKILESKINRMINDYDNSFMLLPNNTHCFFEHTYVDFTPKTMRELTVGNPSPIHKELWEIRKQQIKRSGNKIDRSYFKTQPIFNRDYRYFTPGFIEGTNMIFYDDDTPQFQYCKFQQKTKEALNRCKNPTKKKKEQIWKPKPKNPYCHVCKKQYNDYLQHIKDKGHFGKIRKNPVNRYISELTKAYQHKRSNPQDLSQSEETESCLKNRLKKKEKKIHKINIKK